jgi:hypothetical protein
LQLHTEFTAWPPRIAQASGVGQDFVHLLGPGLNIATSRVCHKKTAGNSHSRRFFFPGFVRLDL